MNKYSVFLLMGVVATVFSSAMDLAGAQDRGLVSLRLAAGPQNLGQTASATFVPLGPQTDVVMYLSRVPSEAALPAHLYTYIYQGTCANPGAQPVYSLNDRLLWPDPAQSSNHVFRKRIPATLDTLRSDDYTLVVRSDPADGDSIIFCGQIGHAGSTGA